MKNFLLLLFEKICYACLNGEFLYEIVKLIEFNKIFLYIYECHWKIGELTRKISGLNGDIILSKALTTLNTKGEKLQNLMEDIAEDENDAFEQDGEEIKTIAGKEVSAKLESDDLILHLVSTSLGDLHEK